MNFQTDFSAYTIVDAINFVDQNFNLFAREKFELLPSEFFQSLVDGSLVFEKIKSGFLVAIKKHKYDSREIFVSCELIFIYIAPEMRRAGNGRLLLVDKLIKSLGKNFQIRLYCQGSEKKDFFKKCDFKTNELIFGCDTYYMTFEPPTVVISA